MDERGNNSSGWRRLKIFAGLAVVTFAVTMAAVVGNRLSDEALAVLAGAVCGVGAAIPTSLIIVAVSQRRRDEQQTRQPMYAQGTYPPVVVVTPQGGQQPNQWNMLPPALSAPMQRTFTVVGGTATDAEVGHHERYS